MGWVADLGRTMSKIMLAVVLGVSSFQAAADPCDPRLVQPERDPNGYRLRGDRCEGIFIQPVAGSASLLIASFTQTFPEFDPRAGLDLRLEWTPAAVSKPTQLRAYGLRRRQYYRMDVERPPDTRSYLWPTTVLGNLELSRRFVGVVAWNEIDFGSQSRRVYLPLRIGAERPLSDARAYELILVPDVELTEVFLSLAAVDRDGKPGQYDMQKRPLGYGYYPQQQGIKIPISGLNRAGVHRLEIGVTQRDGGTSNTEVWFHHPGR